MCPITAPELGLWVCPVRHGPEDALGVLIQRGDALQDPAELRPGRGPEVDELVLGDGHNDVSWPGREEWGVACLFVRGARGVGRGSLMRATPDVAGS